MLLDELLAELPNTGMRLNNLFQLQDGTWQANLREGDATVFHNWGRGPSPVEALLAALKCAGIKVEE